MLLSLVRTRPCHTVLNMQNPRRTLLNINGIKRITSVWSDGTEIVEEFDAKNVLQTRRIKRKGDLAKQAKWEWEVGQDEQTVSNNDNLAVSNVNPICIRKDVENAFQWRIRNLPYDENVFDVSINEEEQCLVVRTSNKKYYKKITIPDMIRVNQKLQKDQMSWIHRQNTLIITYMKPPIVLAAEKRTIYEAETSGIPMTI